MSPKKIGELVSVDWAAEAQDFLANFTEAMNSLSNGEAKIPASIYEAVEMLYGPVTVEEQDAPLLVTGFGLGVLAGLLAHESDMRHEPALTKDVALHYSAAFFDILAGNAAEEDEGGEEPEAQ